MREEEVIVNVGHEEFWPVIYGKYTKFCKVAQGLEPIINDIFSQGHSKSLHTVCRHLAKTVSNSLTAVLTLGLNGFGYDAVKIARSMFEGAVTVAYLRKYPSEFQDYMDYRFVLRHNEIKYMEKYIPERLKKIPGDKIKATEDGYKKLKDRLNAKALAIAKAKGKTTKGKVKPRLHRWNEKPFRDMCAEFGFENIYLNFYSLASNLIHANIGGVMAQMDSEPGIVDVDIAPSSKHVDIAFQMAHYACVFAIQEYIELARPDKKEVSQQLLIGLATAWGKDIAP